MNETVSSFEKWTDIGLHSLVRPTITSLFKQEHTFNIFHSFYDDVFVPSIISDNQPAGNRAMGKIVSTTIMFSTRNQ